MEAHAHQGQWLVRVEDIDPPRSQDGATEMILAALESYGFEWDGPVTYQSQSRHHHDNAITRLLQSGQAYPCGCSRRDLGDVPVSSLGSIYPGTCRNGTEATETAIRVRTNNDPVAFNDALQGEQVHYLERESGDFVVLRKDGLIAYHLAVVVDDHLQGVTDVVRGIDLMDSTPRQLWLQSLLGFEAPNYVHIPVATNASDQKLSKSHGAAAISTEAIGPTLHAALETLQQRPPTSLRNAATSEIWAWAKDSWKLANLIGKKRLTVPEELYQSANSGPAEKA